MLAYPAILKKDSNGTYLVTFPDVPEAITQGADIADALEHAVDALETALDMYADEGQAIPLPSERKRNQYLVPLPAMTGLKFLLHNETTAQGVKKSHLAKKLKWHAPEVDRLFNIRHNSRLDKIEAAFNAVGKQITFTIEDAA